MTIMTLDLASRLQPKHLRLVQAIAEHGQVSLAARKLTMTQPAASRMLLEVERLVEAPLFERRPKGMVPTPLGEVLARGASAVLHGLDATAREMEGYKAGITGTVRIGAVTGGAVSFIVPAIQSLETAAQEADIHVDVAPSDQLMAGLINNRYDFILARLPPGTDTRRFEVMRGRVEEIVFLVRAGHPLAGTRALALSDLAGWPWVIQGHGTPLRQAVEEAFQNWAVPTPRQIVNTTSLLLTLAYLNSSDAISPVAQEVGDLFSERTSDGAIMALKPRETIIIAPYHLITRRDHIASPLATRLIDLVAKALARM
jgi:molybdate transport repressor ModE-like protein